MIHLDSEQITRVEGLNKERDSVSIFPNMLISVQGQHLNVEALEGSWLGELDCSKQKNWRIQDHQQLFPFLTSLTKNFKSVISFWVIGRKLIIRSNTEGMVLFNYSINFFRFVSHETITKANNTSWGTLSTIIGINDRSLKVLSLSRNLAKSLETAVS